MLLEVEAHRVHAIVLSVFSLYSFVEEMAKMGAAVLAKDLGPTHAERIVRTCPDILRNCRI